MTQFHLSLATSVGMYSVLLRLRPTFFVADFLCSENLRNFLRYWLVNVCSSFGMDRVTRQGNRFHVGSKDAYLVLIEINNELQTGLMVLKAC